MIKKGIGGNMQELLEVSVDGSEVPENGPRTVEHEYTLNWAPILRHLRASLLISTYQAGKVVVVSAGSSSDDLDIRLSCHNFERAMGVAVAPGRLAVGARSVVWILRDAPAIAPELDPPGTYDGCFLTRAALYTGAINSHELAWVDDELWVVNTLFSCLCTLDDQHSFVPRWRPRFISHYAAEDRCHLNALAMADGKPRYVTVFGTTDTPGGWRPNKVTGGCLIDVPSGEVVVRGLAMPHSPRIHGSRVWLLDSGTGRLVRADVQEGSVETVAGLPGYTRGLCFSGSLAFVGLSKVRESSTFGGVPIAADRERLKCGVAIVDLASGRTVGLLEFHTGIEEIFDVHLVPGVQSPYLTGPYPDVDQQAPIWLAPSPASE
jgi:uncharacterized protein (TIGR03032 family)